MTGADVPGAGQYLRPPGWYRVTKDGWTWVGIPSPDPPEHFERTELVLIEHGAEEVPLW